MTPEEAIKVLGIDQLPIEVDGVTDLSPETEIDVDYDEEAFIQSAQELIDSGMAWQLEGSVGRQCKRLIDEGKCVLGKVGYRFSVAYVPSRYEVEPGTPGSQEYADEKRGSA